MSEHEQHDGVAAAPEASADAAATTPAAEQADTQLPEAAVGQSEAPAGAVPDATTETAAPASTAEGGSVSAEPAAEATAHETESAEAASPVADAENEPAVEISGEPAAEEQPRLARSELKAIIEALIFASPEPLTPRQMYKLLDTEPKEDIQEAVAELKQDYERPGGLQLIDIAGGYQIVTRPDLHEWVRRLFHERTTQKLSVQALETLAVIAYRQPVTALEIAEIRGVNTSGVLNTLLERHLIKIVGRKQVVGRPFMYGTTKEFLIRFGLNDLGDLPKVQDMAEALGFETPAGLVEQNPPEEMLPLEEPDEELEDRT